MQLFRSGPSGSSMNLISFPYHFNGIIPKFRPNVKQTYHYSHRLDTQTQDFTENGGKINVLYAISSSKILTIPKGE